MLQPFTSKDFTIRSLADRISDLPHLVYLYPNICKTTAFSKYYTPFTGLAYFVFILLFALISFNKLIYLFYPLLVDPFVC